MTRKKGNCTYEAEKIVDVDSGNNSITGPISVCQGTTTSYTATPNGSNYVWKVTGGKSSPGSSNNVIDVKWDTSSNPKVEVSFTNFHTCNVNVSKNITILKKFSSKLSISGQNTGCVNTSQKFIANSGATSYLWYINNNYITTVLGDSAVNLNLTESGVNTIKVVEVFSTGCKDSTTLDVNVNTKRIFQLNSLPEICQDIPQKLSLTKYSGVGYNWKVENATILSGNGSNEVTVLFNYDKSKTSSSIEVGLNNIMVCDDSLFKITKSISSKSVPKPKLSVDSAGLVTATNNFSFVYTKSTWYNDKGNLLGTNNSPSFKFNSTGKYYAIVSGFSTSTCTNKSDTIDVAQVVGINEISNPTFEFSAYPNPVTIGSFVNIKLPQNIHGRATLYLCDIYGRKISVVGVNSSEYRFDIPNTLSKGLYNLHIELENGSHGNVIISVK